MITGDKLFDSSEDYNAVNGCYEYHGSIYASLAGFVHVFSSTDEVILFAITGYI